MTDQHLAQGSQDLRDRAVARLKQKRDLGAHLFICLLVNAFLIGIWAVTGAGLFWPAFPPFLWGIGLVVNAWDVYWQGPHPRTRSATRCSGCASATPSPAGRQPEWRMPMSPPLLRRRGGGPGALVVREGVLDGGLPYLAVGQGPPLVVLSGFTPSTPTPPGRPAGSTCSRWRPWPNGSPSTWSTGNPACGQARPSRTWPATTPMPWSGRSLGRSPSWASPPAARSPSHSPSTTPAGRPAGAGRQRLPAGPRWPADATRPGPVHQAGRPRRAWAATGPGLATTAVGGRLYAALLWLAAPRMRPKDPADMLVVVHAEDRFDATPQLHRISAATLVIAGDRDRNYTPELFGETAERIPGARLRLYPGKGHASIATLRYKPAVDEILKFLTDQPTPPPIIELNGAGNTEERAGNVRGR